MNILMVGNGFDLAHGLPTTYNDFLTFLKVFVNKEQWINGSESFDDSARSITKDERIIKVMNKAYEDEEIKNEIMELIEDNIFVHYFIRKSADLGKTWIDFESEIAIIIKQIENITKNQFLDKISIENKIKNIPIYNELSEDIVGRIRFLAFSNEYEKQKKNMLVLDEIFLDNLNRFIRCFEIYLALCEKHVKICVESPDVKGIPIDGVLSFNYTDIYKNQYDSSITNTEYCFIHGKANIDSTIDSNNMVLGIDEYLSDIDSRNNLTFINFRKYYQRIYKQTDYNYIDWLESEENKDEEKNIYIFGHSLDVTDKDVIQKLIRSKNSKVTIFYYDKADSGRKIANLVKVIGIDELNERTRGARRNIEFRQLQRMENFE